MEKITNVLSLFDGLSCGQIALKELGIKVYKYYASEIDKHAIKQTMLNFPDTIQLGSVTDVDVSKLDKIDLLIGGSPCTNFSFAGKRNGMSTTTNEEIYTLERYLELKNNGFEFEGESFLFWEYMRILNDIRKYNPNVKFLLENVEMGKKWEKVLTDAIGIEGVHINAALVSAQNRKRIYWTNIKTVEYGLFGTVIPDIPQPKDRGILLKDILEDRVDEKYYLNADVIDKLVQHRERHKELGHGFGAKFHSEDEKMQALKVGGKGIDDLVCISSTQNHATISTEKSSPLVAAMGNGGGHVPMVYIPCDYRNSEFGKQISGKNEDGEIIPCASMSSCDISDKFVIDANGRIDSDKTGTITARYAKGVSKFGSEPFVCVPCDYRHSEGIRFKADGKTGTLLSRARNDESCGQMVCVAMRGRGESNEQQLEPNTFGKTNALTSVQKDNLIMQLNPSKESGGNQPYQQNRVYDINGIVPSLLAQMSCGTHKILVPEATKKGYAELSPGECFDFENPKSKTRRGRKMIEKSNSLMSQNMSFMNYTSDYRIRRLTPTECSRLQTIPEWYRWECSDTQAYKMLGNGWCVEVIKHIFQYLK